MGRFAAILVAALAASCGGRSEVAPDAPPDAMPPDAGPPDGGSGACRELATTPMALPLNVPGDVGGGGADLQAPATCAVVDAPFGIESAGVDRVLKLGGLDPGMEYGITLHAAADLAFYVITGCSSETGPADGECALYVDATIGGDDEIGRFVATGTVAWLVIDTYSSTPPADGTFLVDVYAITCADDTACGGTTPACLDGRCVGCADGFDCTNPDLAACEPVTHTCTEGDATCAGEDAGDPYDDGPSGGRAITLDANGHAVLSGGICDVPETEVDFFWFTVTTPGETWQFDLGWGSTADLDLYAFDGAGRVLGLSYWERPETMKLTYLAPGTYYVMIDNYLGGSGPAEPYTLTVQREVGPGCTGPDDCAAAYRNQVYRGACVAGACVAIDGAGTVTEGGACDSSADCAPGLDCPDSYFVADADTRDVCARTCGDDADCAALGNYVCTTYFAQNFCVQACTSDDQCRTYVGVEPSTPPWYHLTCQLSTGRCHP